MRKIVHVDLNEFFVQAETLRDPSLKGKPVAVGFEGRRGVISTASYEARAFGVHSGLPTSQAKKLCPSLILVPDHFSYYEELSRSFFSYLTERFPLLEKASIDECYIDMTSFLQDGKEEEQLFDLQMTLYRVKQLKCSIGYGPNKFLAKMGSDYKKPLGLTMMTKENLPLYLWPQPIGNMFGIGKKTAPRLEALGIKNIGDLARTQDPEVRRLLGSSFLYLQGEANGIGDDVVDTGKWDPKSLSAERTFSDDVEGIEELESMIALCVEEAYAKVEAYQKAVSTIELKLRTPDFRTRTKRITLKEPTSSKAALLHAATNFFESVYHGEPLRLLGVGFSSLSDRKKTPQEEKDERKKKEEGLKAINDALTLGGKVMLGSDLEGKKHEGQ